MKRILLFFVPAVLAAFIIGCGKDHQAPTFGLYEDLQTPTNFVATYDSVKQLFYFSWTIPDTASIVGYRVVFSDSSVISKGRLGEITTSSPVYQDSISYDSAMMQMLRSKLGSLNKNLVVYCTVSAVYNNDTFKYFIGPESVCDTAIVRMP